MREKTLDCLQMVQFKLDFPYAFFRQQENIVHKIKSYVKWNLP